MPQFDILILVSQSYLIPIFILGYIMYLYYILPLISIYMKLDTKIVNSKYIDIIQTSHYDKQYKDLHELNTELLIKLSSFYKFYNFKKKETPLPLPILEQYIKEQNNA